jgi:hypothetical protein
MARMHRQPRAVLRDAHQLLDAGQVELRVDALRVQVQRERDEIDVAGALAVAEQRALDALGAGHLRELRRGDRAAAVVVRVHRQHDRVAPRDVAAEPLDLIGVHVGRRHLDGRRQVQDRLARRRRLPDVQHRVADLDGEIELRAGEALR